MTGPAGARTPAGSRARTPADPHTSPAAAVGGGPGGTGRPAGTVRVSVREVREVAFRALLAAGATGGEAATAADLVVLGEVLTGEGVRVLVDELDRVPRGRVPYAYDGGPAPVLHDPAGRGPLLLGPPAADAAAVAGRPVLVRGLAWSPALEWILLRSAARSGVPLAAAPAAPAALAAPAASGGPAARGGPPPSLLVTPDGVVHRAPGSGTAADAPDPTSLRSVPPGGAVLLSVPDAADPPSGLVPVHGPAERDRRDAAALRHGLRADAGLWSAAYAASRRSLVAEAPAP